MDPEATKHLILNSSEPLLLRNMLSWPIMQWSLDDWVEALKHEKMVFRSGYFKKSNHPQWESSTEFVHGDIKYFIKHLDDEDKWLYFDYKYLQEHLINVKGLRDSIDWAPLGFPEIKLEDSTIWIGSKGAHTPCHIDTYGFNLVHQVYGRKLWLLFPPDENLQPTRIPYEESSVFSKLNFFSPSIEDFKNIVNCQKVILNPGDVLFVPHRWWHYVENLETAISVNTWVPMDEDNNERLEESIVQFLMKLLIDSDAADDTIRKTMLNPNSEDELLQRSASASLNILDQIRKKCSGASQMLDTTKKGMNTNDEFLQNVTYIPRLSKEELINFLSGQMDRFDGSASIEEPIVCNSTLVETMEAILHPEVITLIKEKILAKTSNNLIPNTT
nr:unnamed protein product [Callosobruchus chinensis]